MRLKAADKIWLSALAGGIGLVTAHLGGQSLLGAYGVLIVGASVIGMIVVAQGRKEGLEAPRPSAPRIGVLICGGAAMALLLASRAQLFGPEISTTLLYATLLTFVAAVCLERVTRGG